MRAIICITPLLLAACAGSYEPPALTQNQADRLEKALAGMTPGEKVDCISTFPRNNLTVISDSVLLYRVSSRLIYRNDLIGACNGLSRGDTLVTKSWGSQLCRGDLARSANLQIGMTTGSCAIGSFTPYRKEK